MVLDAKKQLRKHHLLLRNNIKARTNIDWSHLITDNIMSYFLPAKQKNWAVYHSMQQEVQTNSLCKNLRQHEIQCLLPKIIGKEEPLFFYAYNEGDELIVHPSLKIAEPDNNNKNMLNPDVILAPLVAFDRLGNRLGFGGGFYDRTLAYYRKLNTELITIGLAFSLQEANHIPTDSYDEKLDYIVTEKEVIEITS